MEPNKGAASQCLLWVGCVFHKENNGFFVFEHNVCIEIGVHGIGAQKNGLFAVVWLKCEPW